MKGNINGSDKMRNSKIVQLVESLVVNGCPFRHVCEREALENKEMLCHNFEESFFPRGIYFNKFTLSKIKIMIVADNPGPVLNKEPKKFSNIDELLTSWKQSFFSNRTPFMRILKNYILPRVVSFYEKNIGKEEILNYIYFTQQVKCGGFKSTNVPWNIRGRCFDNYLKKEIELLEPKVILALGKKVYNLLISRVYDVENMKICWIRHPSYLARRKEEIEKELKRIEKCICANTSNFRR